MFTSRNACVIIWGMKKILVVEDERDVSQVLRKRLEAVGFSVDTVETGYAALAYLKGKDSPDAVILDLMLPERSGVDLLESLKNKWPETKIFIFSAHQEYKQKLYFFKDYIAGFFLKTDGADRLIEAIKGA